MAEYLVEHDPRQVQWGRVRRNGGKTSGVVVIHTAESIADLAGPDTSAEQVAAWIARRDPDREGYGSYHRLVDRDSIVAMVPWDSEAWHDTASNNHSVGISAAVRTTDWRRMSPVDRLAIVSNMAKAARDFAAHQRRVGRPVPPARLITRAEAMRRVPGFVAHGTMDPGRRSDPGADFPWDLFLDLYANGDDGMDKATIKAIAEAVWALGMNHAGNGSRSETYLVNANRAAFEAKALAFGSTKISRDGVQQSAAQELADCKTLLLEQGASIAGLRGALEAITARLGTLDGLSPDDVAALVTQVREASQAGAEAALEGVLRVQVEVVAPEQAEEPHDPS